MCIDKFLCLINVHYYLQFFSSFRLKTMDDCIDCTRLCFGSHSYRNHLLCKTAKENWKLFSSQCSIYMKCQILFSTSKLKV
ncbi:unnamed protein product [Heterobilharzia americana]|nr:unnamed protein product [Heterobilharzia americana]